ncbi:MAG: thiol peroxidase [Spirochaetota bacterium]
MVEITHKGEPIRTVGILPAVGSKAPDISLTAEDLSDRKLSDFHGKTVVLNIFPSIDTSVCAASVRRFNAEAASRPNTAVLCISDDLPFAMKRFCTAEGLINVITLSEMHDRGFGEMYGVRIISGKLKGILSRAVVVIDPAGIITYTEQVPEIAEEPDYAKALAAVSKK